MLTSSWCIGDIASTNDWWTLSGDARSNDKKVGEKVGGNRREGGKEGKTKKDGEEKRGRGEGEEREKRGRGEGEDTKRTEEE